MTRRLHLLLLMALTAAIPAQAAEPKIPIIHSTDLCHPYDDPDDHYDLACLFAMQEFDIRGIVLDLGEDQASRPGRPAVEQMLHITGRKVPYAVGLNRPLRSQEDKAMDDDQQLQGGIRLILSALRASDEKVVIHTAGSCRDVAAAFNREPDLFRRKVKAIYIEAGNGPSGGQSEHNVSLCPFSYLRLLESGLSVYWCPCFGKDGYQTLYAADQTEVVGACTQPVQNYFVYCLSRSKEEPLAFLAAGPKPLPRGRRNMWCTAPLFHAAGRQVCQRGADDFVALASREAEKAGLRDRAVDAFRFQPVRLGVESLPVPGKKDKKPAPRRLIASWDSPQATTYVFRATDPRYGPILASCLRNLLAGLGRANQTIDQGANTGQQGVGPPVPAGSGTAPGVTGKAGPADARKGFTWDCPVPGDCPFPKSTSLTGIFFTGRHSDYRCGDTWYPSWASDGNLYSPWTDGTTDGVASNSGAGVGAKTGHAVMIGDDPLRLTIRNTSPPKQASALPYKGRYPAGSLVYNGVWYYGTYCLGPDGAYKHEGFVWNWPNLGPMPGFQISRDYGKTWEPSPLTPEKPLFPEPRRFLGPVKMGAPHFVDFGKNMVHSPDGKAYMLGMGAEENDPKPRPCIKPGKPGEVFQVVEGCTSDFAHANLSWITADQVYLARVKPSPEAINDLKAWEFFAGHDGAGQPVWTNRFERIKPLVEWNNHMGCVTATYVPGLKKYLMCVTDGWPTVAKMTSYILEADAITGPWRRVCYMKDFGEQGYSLNFPSKFIGTDGRTLWLCYSANFSPGWNGVKLAINPPGGRYGLCLHEVKLLGPDRKAPTAD